MTSVLSCKTAPIKNSFVWDPTIYKINPENDWIYNSKNNISIKCSNPAAASYFCVDGDDLKILYEKCLKKK